MKRSLLLCIISALAVLPAQKLAAQTGDAPPPDTAQLLEALKKLRDMNETGIKNRRNQAYQQIAAAIASPEKAVAFWKEAVKNAQFEGAEHEGAQIRDWREGDGEALNDKLCQGAVHLHLRWLALSLQHAAGEENKRLLPQVIEFTKALLVDADAAEHFNDQLDKAKERNDAKRGPKRNTGEDQTVKRVHDTLLRTSVGASPVARWLQLGELLGEGGRRKKDKDSTSPTSWEAVPGNFDGIYNAIILPEYRAAKDPRLIEYWDMILKRETEKAAERKLDVEQRDWTQIKRPNILWGRAQDVLLLGYKNRAINDMFNIVKTFPQHPDAVNWIGQIESVLLGTSPAFTTPPATPSAPLPGTVPAPVPVPPAVATPPTATLAPTAPGATPAVRR